MTEKKGRTSTNWNNLYALVIGVLMVLIVLFYLFTKHFE